jgi:hypothetical protein
MPYIWIPRIPHRKRREMERVVEHVIESAVKGVEGERVKVGGSVGGSGGYLDERRLSEVARKAKVDEYGRVAVVKGEGGQVYLRAGNEEVEIKRSKFMVANLVTGEKKKV